MSGLLRRIAQLKRMRGVLALDILQMISGEFVEVNRRMRLFFTYCVLAGHLVGGERTSYIEHLDILSCIDISS